MAKTEEIITMYLTVEGYDPDSTMMLDKDGTVLVETPDGKKQRLAVNQYEDIIEIAQDGTRRIIAESDLPHDRILKRKTASAMNWRKV